MTIDTIHVYSSIAISFFVPVKLLLTTLSALGHNVEDGQHKHKDTQYYHHNQGGHTGWFRFSGGEDSYIGAVPATPSRPYARNTEAVLGVGFEFLHVILVVERLVVLVNV